MSAISKLRSTGNQTKLGKQKARSGKRKQAKEKEKYNTSQQYNRHYLALQHSCYKPGEGELEKL